MNDILLKYLTGAKLLLGICATAITVLFFFFTLKTGVSANADDIADIQALVEEHIDDHEKLRTTLIENNTNIKLLQQQAEYMKTSLDTIAVELEKLHNKENH